MKVLLLEYLTGGGFNMQQFDRSLAVEGLAMRDALLSDLLDTPGATVNVLHDARLGKIDRRATPRVNFVPVESDRVFDTIWRAQLGQCDAVWPIAPETDGILERLCREVEISAAALLNSSPQAVQLTSSKRTTVDLLSRAGIPAIRTGVPDPEAPPERFPVVVKTDDGVGGAGSRVLRNTSDWCDWLKKADSSRCVIQPLAEGEPRSLSVLFGGGQARLLSCNRQHVRITDHGFVLDSCSVNVIDHDQPAAQRLCSAIAAAIPGLWGYAGIDFLQTRSGPVVLEVNPRLTTSYVGLRAALGINVAALVIELWTTGVLPSPELPRGKTVEVPAGAGHAH